MSRLASQAPRVDCHDLASKASPRLRFDFGIQSPRAIAAPGMPRAIAARGMPRAIAVPGAPPSVSGCIAAPVMPRAIAAPSTPVMPRAIAVRAIASPSTPPILPPTPISPVTTGVSTACGGYSVCGRHNFCVSVWPIRCCGDGYAHHAPIRLVRVRVQSDRFTVATVDYKIPHGDTRWFTVNVCKTYTAMLCKMLPLVVVSGRSRVAHGLAEDACDAKPK